MRAMRQDAWTAEDDEVLANILIRHIRQGSTQLAAFEEAASILGRTSAACGYRWNAVVRNHHQQSIQVAKEERKKGASHIIRTQHLNEDQNPAWLQIVKLLRIYKKQYENLEVTLRGYQTQLEEKEALTVKMTREMEQKTLELNDLKEEYDKIKKEYQTLLFIVDRARRISEEDRTGEPLIDERRFTGVNPDI